MVKEGNVSRAALLPMPGDPVILTQFVRNFEEVWFGEVDRLYILLNMDENMPQEVIDYDLEFLKDREKIVPLFTPVMLYQGAALRHMLSEIKEDIIMSIEDDTVIVERGQIDKCFRKIETDEADVIGSPRFSCSQDILDASASKYSLDYSGYGDKGPNMWPNFFFIRKSHLLATDLHFEPKTWKQGEYIKELDITAGGGTVGDVFVWLCIQLRAMGLRFYDVPQCHSHPQDLLDFKRGEGIFAPLVPWVHIGSLTLTAHDFLIGHRTPETSLMPASDMEKKEMERRYAWLLLFLELNPIPELEKALEMYVKRMNKFITAHNLSVGHIEKLKNAYRGFIRW